jgi:hypothetical protein
VLKMTAISIRQPWASMIVHVGKDYENRVWPTRFRGPFLIHAAKGMTDDEYRSAIQFAHFTCGVAKDALQKHCEAASLDALRGGIVGYAEVTDCVGEERHASLRPEHRSPWFMGPYGFHLANVQPLPFLPYTGRLGFFEAEVPDDYIPAHLRERLAA